MRVGTSGWNYPHWASNFYPKELPKNKWLEHYASYFDTIELNTTFYRLPQRITFENWKKRTPDRFLWSVKASRYITHIKKLREVDEPLQNFYNSVDALEEKLGPILIQLPPRLKFVPEISKNFLKKLDPRYHYALEARNDTWVCDEAIETMKNLNIAFCIADTAGKYPYSEFITARFIYIRLHGSQKLYTSLYSDEELKRWAEKIQIWGRDTFIYFDNDFEGNAVKNGLRLKELLHSETI